MVHESWSLLIQGLINVSNFILFYFCLLFASSVMLLIIFSLFMLSLFVI
jgi:hypothetical protein